MNKSIDKTSQHSNVQVIKNNPETCRNDSGAQTSMASITAPVFLEHAPGVYLCLLQIPLSFSPLPSPVSTCVCK